MKLASADRFAKRPATNEPAGKTLATRSKPGPNSSCNQAIFAAMTGWVEPVWLKIFSPCARVAARSQGSERRSSVVV